MTEAQKQIIQRLDQILAATGGGGGGGVTDVTGTAPVASSGGATPAISIAPATSSDPGSMSAADKTKLDTLSAHSGGVLGVANVVLDGVGPQVPTFATGILAGGGIFSSSSAGRIVATFASAQPDTNYSLSLVLYQDGFSKISNKTVDGFEVRAVDPGLVEYTNVMEISVLRLSQ